MHLEGIPVELAQKPNWRDTDTAKFLDVSPSMVRQLVMRREIPHIKIGKSLRFDPIEVRAWLDTKRVRQKK